MREIYYDHRKNTPKLEVWVLELYANGASDNILKRNYFFCFPPLQNTESWLVTWFQITKLCFPVLLNLYSTCLLTGAELPESLSSSPSSKLHSTDTLFHVSTKKRLHICILLNHYIFQLTIIIVSYKLTPLVVPSLFVSILSLLPHPSVNPANQTVLF